MKRFGSVLALMVVLLSWVSAAARENKVDVKELEKCLERVLKAYNDNDHEKFWAEYCSAANDIKTKKNFEDFRAGIYKNHGKFVKRGDLVKDKSMLEGENGQALYKAEFEKEKKLVISIVWVKEGKEIKLAQLEIGPPPE